MYIFLQLYEGKMSHVHTCVFTYTFLLSQAVPCMDPFPQLQLLSSHWMPPPLLSVSKGLH